MLPLPPLMDWVVRAEWHKGEGGASQWAAFVGGGHADWAKHVQNRARVHVLEFCTYARMHVLRLAPPSTARGLELLSIR
jgi:hypothetical protein